jgi:hypothetical protein
VPVSGSNVSKVKNQSQAAFGSNPATTHHGWDEELYTKTSKDCAKRGSIVSRGTLVVVRSSSRKCVSLVDEANVLHRAVSSLFGGSGELRELTVGIPRVGSLSLLLRHL